MNRREAALYAVTHRGNAGDAAFYAAQCRGARVLELGVGYGRLVPVLASACRTLVGLELDNALLALARARASELSPRDRARVELVRGDMRSFELAKKFDRVIVPYNALYCLLTRRAALACLRAARAHLEPEGELALDVWAADGFHRARRSSNFHDDGGPIVAVEHGNAVWDVYEKSRLRRAARRLDVVYTYVSRQRGTRVEIPIQQRYFTSAELRAVLARAGFDVVAQHGDFAGGAFDRRSEHLVIRARPARS